MLISTLYSIPFENTMSQLLNIHGLSFFHVHLLLHLQVSVSLVQSGDPPENHELIELVACPETGFVHLFSQHQLQVK